MKNSQSFIFNPKASLDFGKRSNGVIMGIIELSNESTIIYGEFSKFDRHDVGSIAILNTDLSFNETTTALFGSGVNGIIYDIALKENGQLIIVGNFRMFNSIKIDNIIVLNKDFSFDFEANNNIGKGTDGEITCASLLPDNRVMISGDRHRFDSFRSFNGHSTHCIAILNSDFTFNENLTDLTYQLFTDGYLKKLIPLPDALWLGIGSFGMIENPPPSFIAVFNHDLSLNETKSAALGKGADDLICDALILPDKRLLLCGDFEEFNGHAANFIAILNEDFSFNKDKTNELCKGSASIINKASILSNRLVIFGLDMNSFNYREVKKLAWFDMTRCIEYESSRDDLKITINGELVNIPPGSSVEIKSLKTSP